MKKTKIKPVQGKQTQGEAIEEALMARGKEFEAISKKYQDEFNQNHDPQVVADFIKKCRFAIQEKWVVQEFQKWAMNLDYDKLKLLQPKRGERRDANLNELNNLMIFDRVNNLVRLGCKTPDAFEKLSKVKIGGGIQKC